MICIVDNYDSFVHNLGRYFRLLGFVTSIARNDEAAVADIRAARPEAIVLSPGPCTPNEAGIGLQLVAELAADFPILGVCLGHQTIVQSFGGRVVPSRRPMHGMASDIHHRGHWMFAGVPPVFRAGRYHSLEAEADSLPDELEPIAWTAGGEIMAVCQRGHTVVGLQFHPESILTPDGVQILANFAERVRSPKGEPP
jgi:anthranilate synthase/aminodeoxychorismate synthase-like glutamine amidotransferase